MIETDRLILRPFMESDAEDAFEYLERPTVNCFASMKVNSLEEAEKAVLSRAKEQEFYFAIVLKDCGKVIGEIDAMPEATAPDEENAALDTFSPCWMLNTKYKGKNYIFAMNGQTGRFVGDLPVDWKAFFGWWGGLTAVIGLLGALIGLVL